MVTPQSVGTSERESMTTGTGMDPGVMAALSYLLGFVTGIVVYFVEREDAFVRFHAAQSIAFSAAVIVASIALTVVQTLVFALFFSEATAGLGVLLSLGLGLVWLAVSVLAFVAWVYLMVRAYQGRTPRIPVVAGIADRIAA